MPITIDLVLPSRDLLPGYEKALEAGWSSNTTRDVSDEELRALRADPDDFLADQNRQEGTVTLADGRVVPRLPFRKFWISDGEFCGVINFRYQPGTEALPAHCSGHIGFAVVPWKRGRGYASEALRRMLPVAREVGMHRVLITCDELNLASRKVILANGGVLAGTVPSEHGPGAEKLLFWVGTSP